MTPEEHILQVRADGQALCRSLVAAIEADVSQALLLPELIAVLREGGLLPDMSKLPSFLRP